MLLDHHGFLDELSSPAMLFSCCCSLPTDAPGGAFFMCSECLEIVLVNNVLVSCIWFLRLKLILTTIGTMGSKPLLNTPKIRFVVLSGIVTRSELP